MTLGPIVRREILTSSRRRSLRFDRVFNVFFAVAIVAAIAFAWDWWGRDRSSVAGSSRFALTVFGALVAVLLVTSLGLIPNEIAGGIASERDRKTLDALLATQLSSREIVLGVMGAGLLKSAALMAGALPVLALTVFFGGVDPRLVLLSLAGVASTMFALAALSVAISVGSRTARRALSATISLALSWVSLPIVMITILPRFLPTSMRWVTQVGLLLLESSPLSILAYAVGINKRGTLVEVVQRMIVMEWVGGVALVLWAVWRLRPASRAVYDAEGRLAFLRSLRTKRGRRPECGDDPVLWNEKYSTRGASELQILLGRLIGLVGWGVALYITSCFAWPAFLELLDRGYGATANAAVAPELNPFARMLVSKVSGLNGTFPGQARLDFNIALRQSTMMIDYLFLLTLCGLAAESVVGEKEQDTWPGLIVTPLTGNEIIRAKMLGTLWRIRWFIFLMTGLWTLGFVLGAVHPLGYLISLAGVALSAWSHTAVGVWISLWAPDRKRATGQILLPATVLPIIPFFLLVLRPGVGSILPAAVSMPFLTWASLLSYEDVAAVRGTGGFPLLTSVGINTGDGAVAVAACVLIGLAANAAVGWYFTRASYRQFDAAVGRPVRSLPEVPPLPARRPLNAAIGRPSEVV